MPESPIDRDAQEWPFEQVIARLERMIAAMPTGARLPDERTLSERYGVARGTVRRALEELTTRGLVIARPRRGRFVAARPNEAVPGHDKAPPATK